MTGPKFSKSTLYASVEAALQQISVPGGIAIYVTNHLEDDYIFFDKDQMGAVFRDLVSNAIESIRGTGEVRIELFGDEKNISIEIQDTGHGIDEKDMSLVLTPFFTTKPVGDSVGLGLPLAYATVKAHNGRLEIASNADPVKGPTGTTVKIVLPRRQVFQAKDARIIVHEE